MSDGYELSDAEKRDLIKLITEGKPLPEKYRFQLFQDKREVELVWNGKTREVSTAVSHYSRLSMSTILVRRSVNHMSNSSTFAAASSRDGPTS
jgi:hypothetical protein